MLRKITAVLISGVMAVSFSSCGKKKNDVPAGSFSASLTNFVYENADSSNSESSIFAVWNDLLYVISPDDLGEQIISVRVYNADGKESDKIEIGFDSIEDFPEGIPCPVDMDIYEGKLYILCKLPDGLTIYSYAPDSKKLSEIFRAEEFAHIEKMDVSADGIYIIGTPGKGAEHISEKISGENGNDIFFEYDSKLLVLVNENGESEKINTEYPIAFSVRDDGLPVVYAFDTEGGYYFSEIKNKTENKKNYSNLLGLLSDIDIFGEDGVVISGFDGGKLCTASIIGNTGAADILEDVFIYLPGDVKCTSDHIFYKSGDSVFSEERNIHRINTSEINMSHGVRLVTSQHIENMPFSCGYKVSTQQLLPDVFSVRALSLSDTYDICCFTSDAGYARNMKTSGLFTSMNDIPGVQEYIDKCFPYLKEACTNEKGEIWALPVALDIPVIVYNKFNCEKYGFDFNGSLDDLIETVRTADEMGIRYDCNRYRFIEGMFSRYFQTHDNFDNDDFRKLAVSIKEKCPVDIFKYDPLIHDDLFTYNVMKKVIDVDEMSPALKQSHDEIFFTLIFTSSEQTEYLSEDESLCAAPLPKLSEDTASNAACTFLCINPGTKNMENAKGYISALAMNLSAKKNNLLFSSSDSYSDNDYCNSLREIYSDAQIYFSVPSVIYEDDFEVYCNGGTDLERLIRDSDGRMRLYLSENE
ncbi:MAG: hypothetical protein J1E40_03730 [Oscillospiraceae bacterium]|nr:hypothetical protein [Oscillospiraceae bacterium]